MIARSKRQGTKRRLRPCALTREMDHPDVGASHELNVHRLPHSSGINIPRDVARGTLVLDIAGAGLRRVGVCACNGDGGEKGGENSSREHVISTRCRSTEGVVLLANRSSAKSNVGQGEPAGR